MKRKILSLALVLASVLALSAPGAFGASGRETAGAVVELGEELVALADKPALPTILKPEASGKKVTKNVKATVDYSNAADGYVMVRFTAASDKPLKVKVFGPTTDYQYNIKQGEWTTFPLSDGNGEYKVKVYEKKDNDPNNKKYAVALTASFTVELTDEFAPFIRPNQYVDYGVAEDTVAKAAELTKGLEDPLKKVEKVYDFVVKEFTYDKEKADGSLTGYLPVLDEVLKAKKGICFDYAALMAGMLRSQGIPCKLVVGYAGTIYHAWISVWTEEQGWVENVIFFDGKTWQRMDPTFASTQKESEDIMKYIGDGKNYTVKFLY